MEPQPRTERRAVNVYLPDRELNTTRRKRVAWRITCKRCGNVSQGRTIHDALGKSNAHECESHG